MHSYAKYGGCNMNRFQFLAAVKSYFKRLNSSVAVFAVSLPQMWTPSSKPTLHMAQILAMIIGAVLLLLFIISKFRKNNDDGLIMELDDDGFIEAILLNTAETQTRFDIICTRQGIEHRHLQGYCRISENPDLTKKLSFDELDSLPSLVLDIHDGGVVTGWDEAPIDVYFQLTQQDVSTLYHFASFVTKVRKKGSRTILEIIRPSILSDSKAKDTVRIEPTPEMIALASAWFYDTAATVLPRSVTKLGKSHAAYRPQGNSDFRVVSITASGIRLRFLRDLLEEMESPIKKGHQLCLLIAINTGQEQESRILLWLKGTCTGFAPCLDPECLDALFSFTHWQQICQRSDEIKWYPATDTDRVPPLMHWIMNAEVQRGDMPISNCFEEKEII